MAIDLAPKKNNPPGIRASLTSQTKKKIKELSGRCEYCNSPLSPERLEIFQFPVLARPPYRTEEKPENSIIVLCTCHYRQVRERKISKLSLKSTIAKRSDTFKKALRSALLKRDRTYEGVDITKSNDPRRFDVFLKDKK